MKSKKYDDFQPKEAVADMSERNALMIARAIKKQEQDDGAIADYVKIRGHHFDRCLIADQQGIDETIFSDTIKKDHLQDGFTNSIEEELGLEALKGALTLFQWLTTNCGKTVLEEALKQTGRMIVNIPEDKPVLGIDRKTTVSVIGCGEIAGIAIKKPPLQDKKIEFVDTIVMKNFETLEVTIETDGSYSTHVKKGD